MDERNSVLTTLDAYAEAYCAKDIQRLMAVFDDGNDISLIGTGEDELCSGRNAVQKVFERNFTEATARKFEWGWQHVTIVDGFAIVATTVNIHLLAGESQIVVPIRWTIGLVRRPNGWRWLHRNASTAAVSQESGSAYPTSR